ncbi:MAG: 3-dehydroquinate synthase [Synoicihabitans sp.]
MEQKTFDVASYRKKYRVQFSADAFSDLRAELREGDWLFIDQNVRRLFAESLQPIIEHHDTVEIHPVETSKSYDGVRPLILQLIENGFKKNNRLIAIGGGITQDVTAFISSILYRGIDWVFFPSNLLSQGDSCIGSKTSINFQEYKNQLGGFFPPAKIYIAPTFLETLDYSEICSGLGEMAHYFLVENDAAFARYEGGIDEALKRGPSLHTLIRESLAIKKRMIEIDEFDEGPRNVFNYGHSFGHAIEGYTKYTIPHGIAVSYGMDIANALSVHLGLLDQATCDRISHSLRKVRTTTSFPDIDSGTYLTYLKKDKKNTSAGIRVVLSRGIGEMFLTQVEANQDFMAVISKCFDSFQSETK